MISDTERREVAQRLRELDYADLQESLICAYLDALGIEGYADWVGIARRLADLIEPSGHERVPGECPLNVRHDNDRIDRERLLAIATVMAADSVRSAKQGSSASPVYILHAARNIAEACGETFGSIRNRELIGK